MPHHYRSAPRAQAAELPGCPDRLWNVLSSDSPISQVREERLRRFRKQEQRPQVSIPGVAFHGRDQGPGAAVVAMFPGNDEGSQQAEWPMDLKSYRAARLIAMATTPEVLQIAFLKIGRGQSFGRQ